MYGRACILLFLGILSFLSFSCLAQETAGSLQGRVTDGKGQPLSGVTLTAIHQPSGTVYSTQSLSDGRYIIPNLRIGGPYQLTASYVGMAPQVRDALQVSLGEPLLLDMVLTDSSRQLSEVVVRAARTGVRANLYGTGQNISQAAIARTPTISRSLTDITRAVPQASKDNSFGGANFRYNNVTIDGAINNDAIGFSPSAGGITGTSGMPGSSTRTNSISLDAIQDVQVYLAPYDVSIGNFTGGSINAVTRSGTNQLHGSVYIYGRNGMLTGKDNAGDKRSMPSSFHDYQAGFRLGGPIIKNKLFFFTNEEITERQEPLLLEAGTAGSSQVLSLADAQKIRDSTIARYGADPGAYGQFRTSSKSSKLFNRLDWNINPDHQLALRNNTILSRAINLERDQQEFRFGSIAYEQVNNQSSTVAELRSKLNNQWSNSLILSYAAIHDYRNPTSDPAFPQVQIVGRTPGTTIFFGTDREAAIFDMKQQSIEITDNTTINLGKHSLTVGTHNELYNIQYGFVNSWNGRVDYPSIEAYLANSPNRVRGSYNYFNNTRSYIMAHPTAKFRINFYSAYIQDENRINRLVKITYGLRFDYTDLPKKPILSQKTRNANADPDLGFTYSYTPLNRITNHYFSRIQLSPRIGFNADIKGDKSIILRGGLGLFTGRIPFAWLGYAFYNNGDTYGAYDQRADGTSPVPFNKSTDPIRFDKQQGVATFAAANGQAINNPGAGKTQVDVVDNRFVMPKLLRASFAVDYTDVRQIRYTLEGMVSQTLKDVKFQQVNLFDQPQYYRYDTPARRQPIFASGAVDPSFANAYELSNTKRGYRFSVTAQVSRNFPWGLYVNAAYTYGQSKDIANGIRNSMESNWQLNQALNPNDPKPAWSNFDVRHRIVAQAAYACKEGDWGGSGFSLFFQAQSGAPFTYGFINYTIQNTPQQVSLAYIPLRKESINFFQSYTDESGNTLTAAQQADAFDKFIDGNAYLNSRRGMFTERNAGRTPWNVQADLRLTQDFFLGRRHGGHGDASHVLTFTWDIINFTNLLNSRWGWVYFVPNTYNSTESVGLIPFVPAKTAGGYPIFTFQDPGKPYSVDYFNSRYQMQLGLRYSF